MSTKLECVKVEGQIKHETEKAIQVLVERTGELVWFPLSQVESIHRQSGYIVVTDWIAKQKGLK